MSDLRRVVPRTDGEWAVLAPDAKRASSRHHERYDAVAVARRTLQNNGGGVLEVLDEFGEVVERVEVSPIRNRRVGDLKSR